jgi:hypothetical protein
MIIAYASSAAETALKSVVPSEHLAVYRNLPNVAWGSKNNEFAELEQHKFIMIYSYSNIFSLLVQRTILRRSNGQV